MPREPFREAGQVAAEAAFVLGRAAVEEHHLDRLGAPQQRQRVGDGARRRVAVVPGHEHAGAERFRRVRVGQHEHRTRARQDRRLDLRILERLPVVRARIGLRQHEQVVDAATPVQRAAHVGLVDDGLTRRDPGHLARHVEGQRGTRRVLQQHVTAQDRQRGHRRGEVQVGPQVEHLGRGNARHVTAHGLGEGQHGFGAGDAFRLVVQRHQDARIVHDMPFGATRKCVFRSEFFRVVNLRPLIHRNRALERPVDRRLQAGRADAACSAG